MHYGHPPHEHKATDLTIIKCYKCNWVSPELTRMQLSIRGLPWYCAQCGHRVAHFVTFDPSEREEAHLII